MPCRGLCASPRSAGAALADRLVEHDRGRRGDVETVGLTVHGDPDTVRAGVEEGAVRAVLLAADGDGDATGVVDVGVEHVGLGGRDDGAYRGGREPLEDLRRGGARGGNGEDGALA